MNRFGTALLALSAALAGGAASAQDVQIRETVANVTVIPEDRSDVAVTVTGGGGRMAPLQITRRGDRTIVEGDIGRSVDCNSRRGANGETIVEARTRRYGVVPFSDAFQIVVRTPRDARVAAGGVTSGNIGRANSVSLSAASCGSWTIANVAGLLKINSAGSGEIRAGTSRSVEVNLAGSGDVLLQPVGGGLEANIAGSGDVRAASVAGEIDANIAGSGDVRVDGGRSPLVRAQIVGSGDVIFAGHADRAEASIMGSGDLRVRSAGSVSQRVMGSGAVVVASRGD